MKSRTRARTTGAQPELAYLQLADSARTLARVAEEGAELAETIAQLFARTLKAGRAIYFCGNGGSAADSQHLACELSGKFFKDRTPLNAASLNVNVSVLTALSNDFDYAEVFERQVRAHGRKGDILVGITTSGRSVSILNALKSARKLGLKTVGFTGEKGRSMGRLCDLLVVIPSEVTPRIQEGHILMGHVICARTEAILFP